MEDSEAAAAAAAAAVGRGVEGEGEEEAGEQGDVKVEYSCRVGADAIF